MSQRTHVCHVQKDSGSDASRLLDLGGLAVDRIESDTFGGRVVHLVTADETASACPSCGVLSASLKALVCTRPRDIPAQKMANVMLVLVIMLRPCEARW